MGLTEIINNPVCNVFRRAYIKRKSASTGLFEADWQPITPYVIQWGSIKTGVDDVKLNRFTLSGITLQVDNKDGKFNDENNYNSLWYGYLTRYGTLLKIEAGYQGVADSFGWGFPWGEAWGAVTEYPAVPTQGIFLLDQEMPITSSNKISLNASSLKAVFEGVKANEIGGLGPTQTASELVTKIRDHTDGAGNFIFRQFISAASWSIQATTNYYNIATSTALDNEGTAWDFMTKIAEAEGYVVYINRFGGLVFGDRTPNTSASQFSFYGQGFSRQNVMRVNSYKEALNKVYNTIKVKYLPADTTTSYVTAGTTTAITPANVQWKYGARIYDSIDNTFIVNTATAQGIADNLFNEYSIVKNEVEFDAKFHPELDPLDRVDINHYSYNLANKTLWDAFNWGGDNWAIEGENFDWDSKPFKILSKTINLDTFKETFIAREI